MLEKFEREKQQDLFMPPPPDTVEEMAAQLVADGFLHLPGALSPEQREEFIKLSHWTFQLQSAELSYPWLKSIALLPSRFTVLARRLHRRSDRSHHR